MSDAQKIINAENGQHYLVLSLEVSPKGLKTFIIDLDENELIETGTRSKNGRSVGYQRFKLIGGEIK